MILFFLKGEMLLKFEQIVTKEWKLIKDEEFLYLKLIPSSVTNKFHIVTSYIERVSEYCGEEFDEWFFNLIKKCENPDIKIITIYSNIDKLKEFSDKYISNLNIDYSKFVDESKAKKNSILFSGDEIEKISRLSCYLKLYSVISNNENLKLGQKHHKEVYNKIAQDISETDIIQKIFKVVKTKTFRYNLTDRYMWDYIKTVQCKDIGVHVIEIFNFIMNYILILCEEDKNPIIFFIGVIDESVKWFLRSVYKGSIVYDDSISTEDIQGINTDNLKTYSYNDTLGRLKTIAFEKIYEILERKQSFLLDRKEVNDQTLINFHNRISDIEFISPLCESIVFPVLSKITDIPFEHLKTLSPGHAAVISVYMQDLFRKVFYEQYKYLTSYLHYFPKTSPAVTTTYTIKAVHEYLRVQNKIKSFFGFSTKIMPHRLMCHYIGRVARINFCDVLSGKELSGIPLSKIENDFIHFHSLFFANKLSKEIDEMANLLNKDF